jgi:hypothetical protein
MAFYKEDTAKETQETRKEEKSVLGEPVGVSHRWC